MIGTFSGCTLDAGYYHAVAIPGMVLQLVGIFMTSLASEYWQLMLFQGFCQGIGSGLVFTPTRALVSPYFTSVRAIAVCSMSNSIATSRVISAIIARQLLDRVGSRWTVRRLS